MNIFQTTLTARLIIILGAIDFILVLLVLGSCRCLGGSKLASRLMNNPKYRKFFKYHCYLWWLFWPTLIAHAFLGIMFFGWPS
jgi:hypothetical protein